MELQEEPSQTGRKRRTPRSLSEVLLKLSAETNTDDLSRVSVQMIRNALADRSLATFLTITCLMNLLPFPPGTTLILGVPVILVALQMVWGSPTVWLPKFFLNMSLSDESFNKLTIKIVPRLQKLERWLRPRWWPFSTNKLAERVIGIFALIIGIFVFVPVPGSNWLPALSGAICGLALSQRDGKWLAAGVVLGVVSCSIVAAGLFFGGKLAIDLAG